MLSKKKSILFIGELPNSIQNGISISNQHNLDVLGEFFDIYRVEEDVDYLLHAKFSVNKISSFFKRVSSAFTVSNRNKYDFVYLILPTSFLGQLKVFISVLFIKFSNFNTKFLLHIHRGDLIPYLCRHSIHLIVFKFIIHFTHRFLILSETVLTDNSELKLFDSKKFFVLENTVFNEQDMKIVYSHRSSFRFVYISHFIPEKGHFELMNFLTKWESFNFRLSCYGKKFDSSYYAALIALQSDQLLLMDEIRDDEKFEILKNADFFIMPSQNEGQPLVLLEAMMCGVVIIANDVGFVKDMFWPGYPYIYKGNSFSELNRMMQLISTMSEQEFYQMKIDLKNYYFSRFSNQKHKLKLLNIFN